MKNLNPPKTGIKEKCIFHELQDFHVILNAGVDAMHDFFEGISNLVITAILLQLIFVKGKFSLDDLSYRLRIMDFGFESANVPLEIKAEYLQKNKRLKMSATEMLFFTRYLSVIIGDLVPVNHTIWPLYIALREVVDIITSPIMTKSRISVLEKKITELNKLYVEYAEHLRPKCHFMVHYPTIIKQNGPVIKFACMRNESKHREIKACIQNPSSHTNVLTTVSTRYQLGVMHRQFSEYKEAFVTYGSKIEDNLINLIFPSSENKFR